jgi:hypothetical protein
MTRDRFFDIVNVLHLANNSLQPSKDSRAYDRLYKVLQQYLSLFYCPPVCLFFIIIYQSLYYASVCNTKSHYSKVRELLTNLNKSFKENAEMEEIISVDEQMIPYKGTLGIKVYMKNKPSKWGIKVNKKQYFYVLLH